MAELWLGHGLELNCSGDGLDCSLGDFVAVVIWKGAGHGLND
jgi:hypothetical protein